MLSRTILEEAVLLYKSETGKVVALQDRCCHRGVPLHLGWREGDCVRCTHHGLKFDPSGKCVQIPLEDKHLIEAQQKVLDDDPDFRMLAVAADAALSHFRWTFDKLVSAERAAEAAEKAAAAPTIPIRAPHQAGLQA